MRRNVGRVLLGIGVFLLVLAPLLRFYAYPKLAVVPKDQDSVSVSFGPDANVFDLGSLSNITTDLTSTRTIRGDVEASDKAGDNIVVWVTTVSSRSADGKMRSRYVERVAFDATTAESVNCCGEYLETAEGRRQDVKHEGLVFKFPFDTQKKTYDFWDSTLEKALPAEYKGEEKVDGVNTYKFVQVIEPTPSAEPEQLPASLLHMPGQGTVEAQRYYSNVRTVWIEPNTGVIIKGQEAQYNTIRAGGKDRLITTDVTIAYNDKTVKDNADKYGPKGTQIHLVRSILPLAGLIVGVILVAVGLFLALRGRRRTG